MAIKSISDEQDLQNIINDLNGEYQLSKDITITSQWIPIFGGTPSNTPFSGKLDGNGHSIIGLNAPLFVIIEGALPTDRAEIKNLTLQCANINLPVLPSDVYPPISPREVGSDGIGGALAQLAYNASITNVHVTTAVGGTISGGSIVGAIIGAGNAVDLIGCTNSVTVVGGYAVVNIYEYDDGDEVEARAVVEEYLYAKGFVGGIAGIAQNGVVVSCVNSADISLRQYTVDYLKQQFVLGLGGILGRCTDVRVTDCKNEGTIDGGPRSDSVGGIVGLADYSDINHEIHIENCLSEGDVIGASCMGGVVGFAYGLQSGWSPHMFVIGNLQRGKVISAGTYGVVGGIVGCLMGSTNISNNVVCKEATIQAEGDAIGGIMGHSFTISSEETVTAEHNIAGSESIVGGTRVYGIIGTLQGDVGRTLLLDNQANPEMLLTGDNRNDGGIIYDHDKIRFDSEGDPYNYNGVYMPCPDDQDDNPCYFCQDPTHGCGSSALESQPAPAAERPRARAESSGMPEDVAGAIALVIKSIASEETAIGKILSESANTLEFAKGIEGITLNGVVRAQDSVVNMIKVSSGFESILTKKLCCSLDALCHCGESANGCPNCPDTDNPNIVLCVWCLLTSVSTGMPLQGALFDLYQNGIKLNEEPIISNTDGTVDLGNLSAGSYTLTETSPAPGYKLPDEPNFMLVVNKNGTFTISHESNAIGTTIHNSADISGISGVSTPASLPSELESRVRKIPYGLLSDGKPMYELWQYVLTPEESDALNKATRLPTSASGGFVHVGNDGGYSGQVNDRAPTGALPYAYGDVDNGPVCFVH